MGLAVSFLLAIIDRFQTMVPRFVFCKKKREEAQRTAAETKDDSSSPRPQLSGESEQAPGLPIESVAENGTVHKHRLSKRARKEARKEHESMMAKAEQAPTIPGMVKQEQPSDVCTKGQLIIHRPKEMVVMEPGGKTAVFSAAEQTAQRQEVKHFEDGFEEVRFSRRHKKKDEKATAAVEHNTKTQKVQHLELTEDQVRSSKPQGLQEAIKYETSLQNKCATSQKPTTAPNREKRILEVERPDGKFFTADEADGGGAPPIKAVVSAKLGERGNQVPEDPEQRKRQRQTRERSAAERDDEREEDHVASQFEGPEGIKHRENFPGCPQQIAPVQGLRHTWEIAQGYVPGMRAAARFFATPALAKLCLEELHKGGGGFLPAVQQLANVATLPGLMGCALGMPDIHSGYGFAVGSVAAINLEDPQAVVSPGGVGFDINCGVRLLRTNLMEADLCKDKLCAKLATAIFEAVPAGVGAHGTFHARSEQDFKAALQDGMAWALQRGLCWPEDLERCEEGGQMSEADPSAVSSRAMKRGSPQFGTLGSGNHYLELQVVDEVMDTEAAKAFGLEKGCVCVMIHCGSRGLGHQLCTDYLATMEHTMRQQGIWVPDRQLCCVRAQSHEGQRYLKGMAAAANYAFVNRTIIMHSVREVFKSVLHRHPQKDLGMWMVYDVAHNIAKHEQHRDPADGKLKQTLVHRKGATRAFPAGHPAVPAIYRSVGQPVLIGGSMGTCSYVLAGNPEGMDISFGSTCHGAGRRLSRTAAKREITAQSVLSKLRQQGIEVRVTSPKLLAEEADESYKDVTAVVRTCHEAGISRLVVRLRPLAVIKG